MARKPAKAVGAKAPSVVWREQVDRGIREMGLRYLKHHTDDELLGEVRERARRSEDFRRRLLAIGQRFAPGKRGGARSTTDDLLAEGIVRALATHPRKDVIETIELQLGCSTSTAERHYSRLKSKRHE